MSMARFERIHLLRASLSAEESHLYSFKGFFCKWVQGRFSDEEIPLPIKDAPLLGHVTNARLILEPREARGYLSFNVADMDYLGVYRTSACWPVKKYNMSGRDPAFLPHSLYNITVYTGAIIGLPAVAEFAEVMRERS
jgi:hypothetical protein